MSELVSGAVFGLALICWMDAAWTGHRLARGHRLEGRDYWTYAFNGLLFLSPDEFAPSGERLHQRMLRSAALFVTLAALAALVHVFTRPPT